MSNHLSQASWLRSEWAISVASGHPVLGCPVGTDAHVESAIQTSAKKAAALIPLLDRLLLSNDSGSYAPDERDLLIRFCIWPRLRHLLRTVRPGLGDATFRAFDHLIMEARLKPLLPPDATPLSAPVHIDPFDLASLPGRFGGHGTLLHVNIDPLDRSASNHDVAYYGSMAAVWHYMRTWVVPLQGRCLAHRPAGCGAYQNHVSEAFERLMISFRAVGLTPNHDLLPASSHFPELHSRLDDGRLSPATVPLGAAAHRDLDESHDSPSFIYDLDSLDATCHPHAQRAASAVVTSRAFLVLLNDPATTATGRARLLDGSSAKGPFSWLRRLPIPSSDPCDTPFFAFQVPQHFPVALALDLLLSPPTQGEGNIIRCTACATVAQPLGHPLIGPGDRHFVPCPHGMRLHSTCHDPAVQAFVPFLDAILGASRVTAERGGQGGQRAVDQWMQGHPISHVPDIILHDYDGPNSFVLIDIKTLDAAGSAHIAAHHTDRARLSAHLAIAAHSRRNQYGDIGPNMRIVIIAISTCGAINSEGIDFISHLAKRTDNSIPPALLHQASLAAPRLAPMIRMALGFAVRRGLAAAVYHSGGDALLLLTSDPRRPHPHRRHLSRRLRPRRLRDCFRPRRPRPCRPHLHPPRLGAPSSMMTFPRVRRRP